MTSTERNWKRYPTPNRKTGSVPGCGVKLTVNPANAGEPACGSLPGVSVITGWPGRGATRLKPVQRIRDWCSYMGDRASAAGFAVVASEIVPSSSSVKGWAPGSW